MRQIVNPPHVSQCCVVQLRTRDVLVALSAQFLATEEVKVRRVQVSTRERDDDL
jgi:hypothetical protein